MKVKCVACGKIVSCYNDQPEAARKDACQTIEKLLAKGHDIISVSESLIEDAGAIHMNIAIYYKDNG